MTKTLKQLRAERTPFQFRTVYTYAEGIGWPVGAPPCVVVHGRKLKGPTRFTAPIKFSTLGPYVLSTLNTGLSIEHRLFCFRKPQDAIAVAEFIVITAPLLDIPLYSESVHAVRDAVDATNGVFMCAVRDFVLKLEPKLVVELEDIDTWKHSTNNWRQDLIRYVERANELAQ